MMIKKIPFILHSPAAALLVFCGFFCLTACGRGGPQSVLILRIGDTETPLPEYEHVEAFQRDVLDRVLAHWETEEGDTSVWYQVISRVEENRGDAQFASESSTSPFRLRRLEEGGIKVEQRRDGEVHRLGRGSSESPLILEALLKSPLNLNSLHSILTHTREAAGSDVLFDDLHP